MRPPAAALAALIAMSNPPLTATAAATAGVITAPAALTIDRLFDAPDLSGPALRGARFSPDGRLVSYLRARADAPDVYDLWAYDLAAGRHRQLVEARRLAPDALPLSAEEEARRERQRIAALRGIVEYHWSPDGRGLLFPLGGDLYFYDLAAAPAAAVRRLTSTQAYETDPQFSPRGRYVAFVREQNLHVIELATGRERALTTEGGGLVSFGMAEFVAQEEMKRSTGYWWSPDEQRLAVARVDESPVQVADRFEVSADGFRVFQQRYPAAGTPNAAVTLGIVSLDGAASRWLDLGPADMYLARVDWFPEADALLVQRQSRDQRRLDVLRYELAGDGQPRTLLQEQSSTWVELHDNLRFVPDQRQFLWSSNRSGHDHLYLHDYDGRLVRAVTAGDWDLAGDFTEAEVRGVDLRRRRVYFTANEASAIERHLYVASLDTREPDRPQRLTESPGWHAITMSRDATRYLDSRSDPAQPPQLSLHDAGGRRLAWLEENRLDASHPYWPYRPQHVVPEFGTLQSADGHALHWSLLRPPGFDPARRYPAILRVYGGPGVQTVQRRWGDRRGSQIDQVLAARGYVVFALDNRGTGGRGQAFAAPIHLRMGGVEVEDQLRGVEYLKTVPGVDGTRLGVFGWSYGGYMTLQLLMQAPGTFRAGVSGAPVTDWTLYDTHYTERYLGDPKANAAGYAASGVLQHVPGLQGQLLVMHGMADDNVLFTNSTRLFKALVDADKPFTALPYPGSKHAALSFRDTGRHGWKAILAFFDQNLAARDAGQ